MAADALVFPLWPRCWPTMGLEHGDASRQPAVVSRRLSTTNRGTIDYQMLSSAARIRTPPGSWPNGRTASRSPSAIGPCVAETDGCSPIVTGPPQARTSIARSIVMASSVVPLLIHRIVSDPHAVGSNPIADHKPFPGGRLQTTGHFSFPSESKDNRFLFVATRPCSSVSIHTTRV